MIKEFLRLILILIILKYFICKIRLFQEGINLYNENKYEDAKFKFEQDIVFNPKSELSYLYLSKYLTNSKIKI